MKHINVERERRREGVNMVACGAYSTHCALSVSDNFSDA
jgi:hypothetical protein